MGWDYHHEVAPYDRRAICRSNIGNGYEVIKDAVVGTTYYAAVKSPRNGKVGAVIILTKIDRNGYCNFGMKFMDEEMGPYRNDCPKSVLDALSPTDNKYAIEWREACWAKIHEPKDETLKNAPIGARLKVTLKNGEKRDVVKMAPEYQFKTWWLLVADGLSYIPKNRVIKAEVI